MDYTLTKLRSPINNNCETYLKDKIGFFESWNLSIIYTIRFFIGWIGMVLMTYVGMIENIIYNGKSFKSQFYYQKCAKMVLDFNQYEDITFGKLDSCFHKVVIPKNLYVQYFLDGDYQKQIKSISLERNMVKLIKFGKQQIHQQDGWKVCFQFKTPPQDGYCIVRYL